MCFGNITELLKLPSTHLSYGGRSYFVRAACSIAHRDAQLRCPNKWGPRCRWWRVSMWFAASIGCSFWWVVIVVTLSLSHLPKEIHLTKRGCEECYHHDEADTLYFFLLYQTRLLTKDHLEQPLSVPFGKYFLSSPEFRVFVFSPYPCHCYERVYSCHLQGVRNYQEDKAVRPLKPSGLTFISQSA